MGDIRGAVLGGALVGSIVVLPAQVDAAIIRGRVLVAGTDEPVRKALVTVSSSEGNNGGVDEREPVLSDAEGRFEVADLPAGHYLLSAAKPGYVTTRFGARRALDRAITIGLADKAIVEHIEIRLPRGAAITGRIVDDLGEPLVDLTVTAGRVVRTDGRPRFVSAGPSGTTDDLGEYRIGGLAAGSYFVSVSSAPSSMASRFLSVGGGFITFNGTVAGDSAWARTYYPGVASLARAQAVTVLPGEEATAIEFAVTPTRTPRLSLTVTDASGNPASGSYTLRPDSALDQFGRSGDFRASRGGTDSTSIEPGDWILYARGEGGSGTAIVQLSIGSDDLSVNVVLTKGGRLSGRVIFEGLAAAPPNELVILDTVRPGADREQQRMMPTMPMAAMMGPATGINRDGTFTLTDLLGPRLFRVRSIPPGWILKSLTHNGRSLLDGPIEFKGSEEMIGVVALLTKRHAELTGTIVDQERAPVRDYSLIVFPEDRARLGDPSRWTRWVRPDQTGTFVVNDLPAGDYLAAAVYDVDETEWSNADYLERLRPHATRVTLGDDEVKAITLDLTVTR